MEISELILSDEAIAVIDDGTWIGDIDEAPGLELLVTGLESDAAQRLQRQKQAHLRAKNRGKPLSAEQLANTTKEVLAEVVLKGWRGLKSGGEEVEYSPELARKWILSRKGERLTALVLHAAQQVDSYATEFVEEARKN